MSKALDKMGDTAMQRDDEEDDIGAAFQKFAVVTKELGALMKNMVRFTYWNHYPPVKNHYGGRTGKYLALITHPQRVTPPCLVNGNSSLRRNIQAGISVLLK